MGAAHFEPVFQQDDSGIDHRPFDERDGVKKAAQLLVVAEAHHPLDAGDYADVPGFCKSATLDEIQKHGHVLTPGRYVGTAEVEDDGEPFAEKMERLSDTLAGEFEESARLRTAIRDNLAKVGFPL